MDTIYEPFIYLMLRFVLGSLFFFQAFERIFRIGFTNVFDEVCPGCERKGIPIWFSKFSVYITSLFELIGGLLLVAGLFTIPVLYLFGVHMMVVILAFSYLQGLWDMKHVFPRFILLVLLFVLPYEWNSLSIDYLLP